MKKNRSLILFPLMVLGFMAMFMSGCKKDSTSTPSSYFTCKIDGTAFSATNLLNCSISQGSAMVNGSTATSHVYFWLPDVATKKAGTYTYDDISFSYSPSFAADDFEITSGSVVVTNYNSSTSTLTGTFTGVVENSSGATKTITEGKFSVHLNTAQ